MEIVFSLIIPIIAVLAGFYFAVRQYFIQREHEHYRKRYLDEGVDALAAQIEEALQVFRHNWSNGLTVLKQFRDLTVYTDKTICSGRFKELDPLTFKIVPTYRVQTLIKDPDKIIWNIQQSLFAFVKTSTDFFTSDVCSFIRVFLENGGKLPDTTTEDIGTILANYMGHIGALDEKAKSYYLLLEELEKLADELGNQKRLTKAHIDDFHKNPPVMGSIDRLKGTFPKLLPSKEAAN